MLPLQHPVSATLYSREHHSFPSWERNHLTQGLVPTSTWPVLLGSPLGTPRWS